MHRNNTGAKTESVEQTYSVKRTAKHLGVSRQTVRNWIERGWLQAVKFGGRYRVSRASVTDVAERGTGHFPPTELLEKGTDS